MTIGVLKRLCVYLLCYVIALAPAFASQNALFSPTTGTVSGLNLTNSFNNAIDSLNTMNSGASAPTNQLSGTPSLGNRWCNTTASPYPCNVYDGSQWLPPFYIDAINHVLDMQMGGGVGTIGAASTTDLCSSLPQNRITITGSTTISSFGSTCPAGVIKIITFSGTPALTYNATSLIIPGAASVMVAAGDQAVVQSLGSGDWQVVSYTPASGQALINPAIDVGAIEWTFSPTIPSSKYLWAYGQAVSRSTYSVLQTALTITQSVTSTNGSPTLTGFTDTTQIPAGAAIEASFLSAPTTITSCASTTCTMAANANASTTANATVFPYGDGNGSSTFNLPNCAGEVLAGRPNMSGTARGNITSSYFGTNPNALGAAGGSQNEAIAQGNIPSYTLPNSLGFAGTPQTWNLNQSNVVFANGSSTGIPGNGTSANGLYPGTPNVTVTPAGGITGSVTSGGSGSPLATMQPTIMANCMIRVLARLDLSPLPSLAANDNQFAAIEPRRQAA